MWEILKQFEGEFHSQLVRSTTPHTKPTCQALVPALWSWPPVKNPNQLLFWIQLIQYFLTSYFTVHLVLFSSIYIHFIHWCSCMFAVQLSSIFACNNVFICITHLRIPTDILRRFDYRSLLASASYVTRTLLRDKNKLHSRNKSQEARRIRLILNVSVCIIPDPPCIFTG